MAEAIIGIPQGSAIGLILFVIYVNDLSDHLSADSLLYADDFKLIASRNRHYILQNSLNISVSWSKDWEQDLHPTKSEHLPIGNSPHFVTYTLPSHNPPNTQTIPNVSITKDLGIVLNTRPSAEDSVVGAANKARRMPFYLNRSFMALAPCIFLPLYKTFIWPHHEYAIQATHPVLSHNAGVLEKVLKLALKFVKGLEYILCEAALKQLLLFSLTPVNPCRSNIIVQDYPWSCGIPNGVRLPTPNSQRAKRPRLQVPPTEMLYVPSVIFLHHSGCPILEQTADRDSQRIRGEIFQNTPGCPLTVPVPRTTHLPTSSHNPFLSTFSLYQTP